MTKNNLSNGSQQKQNTLQHSGITREKAAHCAEVNVLSVSCWANLNQSLQRNIGVFVVDAENITGSSVFCFFLFFFHVFIMTFLHGIF